MPTVIPVSPCVWWKTSSSKHYCINILGPCRYFFSARLFFLNDIGQISQNAWIKVSKDLRRNAKSVNFGIIYGISAFGLSEQLGIPRKEASALIDEYFTQYPDIKHYIDTNIAFAHEHGYAQTLLGRRRYLTDINSRNASARNFAERNAVNMPIQGTSADMIKIAMIHIYRQFKQLGLRSRMILQVHDELVFDCYKPEEQQVRAIVEEAMLNALPLSIPIEVGIDVGPNWLAAH